MIALLTTCFLVSLLVVLVWRAITTDPRQWLEDAESLITGRRRADSESTRRP